MEKTKKQVFFKNVKNSIFNFDSYQEFAMQDMKKGIFYFLKLSILFSVVISIVFAALQVTVTVPTVKKFIEGDIPNFSYSNGTLDLQSEEPVTIDKIADDVLIIADTKELDDAKINEYKDKINLYEIGVLILKDKIYLKNAYTLSGIQEMKLSDIESVYGKSEFTKQDILNDMNSINMISLCISLAFTVFLGFFLIFVFMSILDIIILALLSNIIAMLSRVKMKASALVNISIHAMTLPIVLLLAYAIVLLTTGFEIKYFNIMYRGISYIYVFTAIFLIRQNLIKQQIELTTIVQKQQELKKELEEKETEEPKENKDDNKSNDKKDEDKKEENKDNNVGKEASGEV
jgi:membrane protein